MRATYATTKSCAVLLLLTFCISCRTSVYAKLHNDLMTLSEDKYLCEIITEEVPIVSSSLLNFIAKPTERDKFEIFLDKILGHECASFILDKELQNVPRNKFYEHLAKLGDTEGYFIEGLQIYNAEFNENDMVIENTSRTYLSAIVESKKKLTEKVFLFIDVMPKAILFNESQSEKSFTIVALLERESHSWKYLAILATNGRQKFTNKVFARLGQLAINAQRLNPKE